MWVLCDYLLLGECAKDIDGVEQTIKWYVVKSRTCGRLFK